MQKNPDYCQSEKLKAQLHSQFEAVGTNEFLLFPSISANKHY